AGAESRPPARRCLPAAGEADERTLPGGMRRTSFTGRGGVVVRLWDSPENLYKEPMARLMYHDVPLATEYAVWLDDDSFVEEGWWQALCPLLDRGVDYIGQPWWVDYLPGQEEMIRSRPWFRGLPLEHQGGLPGAWGGAPWRAGPGGGGGPPPPTRRQRGRGTR